MNNNVQIVIEEVEKRSYCFTFFCWFFQLLTWIFLFLWISAYDYDYVVDTIVTMCFTIIFYIGFISLECHSKEIRYLWNKTSSQEFVKKMKEYCSTPPVIEANSGWFNDKKVFQYYSMRDVSGPFFLNCDVNTLRRKQYIKLEINEEINFADAISFKDYIDMGQQIRNKSQTSFYSEKIYIPGIVRYSLVELNQNSCHYGESIWIFILLMIIPLVEIYKLYIDYVSIYKEFKIRKIISTRYNLNQTIYQKLIPKITLLSDTFEFEPNQYNYKNTKLKVKNPTDDELEAAKPYENYIPNYELINGVTTIEQPIIPIPLQEKKHNENDGHVTDQNTININCPQKNNEELQLKEEKKSGGIDFIPIQKEDNTNIDSKQKLN